MAHDQIKQHMKVLMVNPISSGKIIEKYHELKVARHNNMLARGNFITKNVTEINELLADHKLRHFQDPLLLDAHAPSPPPGRPAPGAHACRPVGPPSPLPLRIPL